MKKAILPLLFVGISMAATAQIKKGSVLLGGQLSFSLAKNNVGNPQVSDQDGGLYNLSVGKAIKDNSVIGLFGGFGHTTNSYFNGTQITERMYKNYQVGVFYREYKPLGKDFYLFGQADLSYSRSTEKTVVSGTSGDVYNKISGVNVGVTPGISHQLLKKLQVELKLPNIFSASYNS